jgi:outer membrane lipoprotein SlyB
MHTTTTFLARTAIIAAFVAGAATPLASQAAPDHHAAECRNCATVVSQHTYQKEPERASGVGAVGGAVVGGLLGNHVGSGNGRTLATVAGAVGGAYGGNRIERNMKRETFTDVRVKMATGGNRTFTEKGEAHYRNGEHVRVVDGHACIAVTPSNPLSLRRQGSNLQAFRYAPNLDPCLRRDDAVLGYLSSQGVFSDNVSNDAVL